ncbi:ROK family transcriptional regulator [Sphaerisporangium fuscum]|uniref:ROK family transcriptional regulator n=1 Tax=Sphaerisporangium fuscum TaxID=2835868 RepID=UPI001BDC81B0|nr:ROK family transcriptional regulator [Sphaerisporangium fuscum]
MPTSPYREDLIKAEILAMTGSRPLNRSEIAARLGLGAATVSDHTRRLIELGFLRELPPQIAGRGRPKVPLEVVPDAAYTLGLRVHPDHLIGVLMRLDGSEVRRFTRPFRPGEDPVGQLAAACEEVLADPAVGARVLGIGLAVPGVIDPATGTVRLSPRLGWTDLPLRPPLAERLPVPVLIDNDTRASTAGELLFGTGRDHDDFLVLAIGDGVGMGIVLERRVHRGPAGVAGEFGHVPTSPDGPRCVCGRRGCVDAYVADYALAAQAVARGLCEEPPSPDRLRRMAEDDAPGVRALLADAGEILGRAAAGVVNVLAVPALTVIGESHVLWPYLTPGFQRAVDAGVIGVLPDLEITVRAWDDSGHARGAASLVLAASLAA